MLLEACTPGAPASTSAGSSSAKPGATAASAGAKANVLPTYVQFANRPKPDYPSQGDPYLDGYENYPKNPVKAISGPVGSGGTVTAMTIGLFPPPTPYENNPAWQ